MAAPAQAAVRPPTQDAVPAPRATEDLFKPWAEQHRPPAAQPPQDASFTLEDEKLLESTDAMVSCATVVAKAAPNVILYTGKGFAHMSDHRQQELIGKPFLQCFAPGEEGYVKLQAELDKKTPAATDLVLVQKYGTKFADCVVTLPVLDDKHALLCYLVFHKEVTDEAATMAADKQGAEGAVDGNESTAAAERHHDHTAQTLGACFVTDAATQDASITHVSPAFQELTGYSPSTMLGRSCLALAGPDTERKAMKAVIMAQQGGQAGATAMLCYREDGTPFWGDLINLPLMLPAPLAHRHSEKGPDDGPPVAPTKRDSMLSAGPAPFGTSPQLCILADVTALRQRHIGRYAIGKVIGRGAFGVVRLGRNLTTAETVAIKMVDAGNFRSIAQIDQVQDEVNVLSGLKHPNIIRLLDVHFASNIFYLVMEYGSGGSLTQYVQKQEGGTLTEPQARRVFQQVADAVDYCHRRRVIHRDLKPENILMDKDGNIKVADFGLAGITTPFSGSLSLVCGTPEFTAPEIVKGREYTGTAVDMWSLGVILYELLVGKLPFHAPTQAVLFKAITRGTYEPMPSTFCMECRDLVTRLLVVKPEERIKMEEVQAHPWLLMIWPFDGKDNPDETDQVRALGAMQQSLQLVIPTKSRQWSSPVASAQEGTIVAAKPEADASAQLQTPSTASLEACVASAAVLQQLSAVPDATGDAPQEGKPGPAPDPPQMSLLAQSAAAAEPQPLHRKHALSGELPRLARGPQTVAKNAASRPRRSTAVPYGSGGDRSGGGSVSDRTAKRSNGNGEDQPGGASGRHPLRPGAGKSKAPGGSSDSKRPSWQAEIRGK